jgi:cyclopropane fatty-acyl-phospholipid synthase-like methyltransferase
VERLVAGLDPGVHVLDLGCGPGVPTAGRLAPDFAVTGVDISARQIDAARTAVPAPEFIVADMTAIEFPSASFAAVVALYSLIHVPNDELPRLLRRIHAWLVPGGLLLATLGTTEGEGVQGDWLGVPMFFAGHEPATNRALIADGGFERIADDVATTTEPGESDVSFHWIMARRGT